MSRRCRALAAAFLFFCAAAASATELQEVPGMTDTVADVLKRVHRAKTQPRASVIAVDWEDSQFLIPAAGSLQGNQGTYYRSDVTIANRGDVTQRVAVLWIAQGVNNGTAPAQFFDIGANTTTISRDFVATVLGKTGLGAIVVVGVDATGEPDPDAEIDGFSRIWTPQPNAAGSVSQEFASVAVEDSLATSYGYGLRQDAQFRTNVGFVNLYDVGNTFTVAVVGTGGNTTIVQDVLPFSMQQRPVPAGNWGDFYIRVSTPSSNFNWWSAYASSTDNISGDGWVSHVH
jgi:hypothetical protein